MPIVCKKKIDTDCIKRTLKASWYIILLYLAFTLLRLALSRSLTVFFIYDSYYDDITAFNKAISIMEGNWLGEYGMMTLVKGVGFPLLTAFFLKLGMPFLFSYSLLYAIACLVFMWAIHSLIKNRWLGLGIYVFLLFNPVAYSCNVTRLYRDTGYYAITFLCVACVVGLLLRYKNIKTNIIWALFVGIFLAFSQLFREDTQWLLIYVVVAVLCWWALWFFVFSKPEKTKSKTLYFLRGGVVPLCILVSWLVCILPVVFMQYSHYGTFLLEDYNTGPFVKAYQAINSVDVGEENPAVVMTKEKNKQLREVSPAYAEIYDFIAGANPDHWWYDSGYFSFFLRESVDAAGYYESPKTAEEFYLRLADEVNAALESGVLKEAPGSIGVAPRFYQWMIPLVIRDTFIGINNVLECKNVSEEPSFREELIPAEIVQKYEDITKDYMAAHVQMPDGSVERNHQNSTWWGNIGLKIMGVIIQVYSVILKPLFYGSFLAVIVPAGWTFYKSKFKNTTFWVQMLVWFSLLCVLLLRVAMLAYVQVGSSFPTLRDPIYQAANYPLVLAIITCSVLILVNWLPKLRREKQSVQQNSEMEKNL